MICIELLDIVSFVQVIFQMSRAHNSGNKRYRGLSPYYREDLPRAEGIDIYPVRHVQRQSGDRPDEELKKKYNILVEENKKLQTKNMRMDEKIRELQKKFSNSKVVGKVYGNDEDPKDVAKVLLFERKYREKEEQLKKLQMDIEELRKGTNYTKIQELEQQNTKLFMEIDKMKRSLKSRSRSARSIKPVEGSHSRIINMTNKFNDVIDPNNNRSSKASKIQQQNQETPEIKVHSPPPNYEKSSILLQKKSVRGGKIYFPNATSTLTIKQAKVGKISEQQWEDGKRKLLERQLQQAQQKITKLIGDVQNYKNAIELKEEQIYYLVQSHKKELQERDQSQEIKKLQMKNIELTQKMARFSQIEQQWKALTPTDPLKLLSAQQDEQNAKKQQLLDKISKLEKEIQTRKDNNQDLLKQLEHQTKLVQQANQRQQETKQQLIKVNDELDRLRPIEKERDQLLIQKEQFKTKLSSLEKSKRLLEQQKIQRQKQQSNKACFIMPQIEKEEQPKKAANRGEFILESQVGEQAMPLNQQPNRPPSMDQIKQILVYRLRAHRYSLQQFKDDLDNIPSPELTVGSMKATLANEPFYFPNDLIETLLTLACEKIPKTILQDEWVITKDLLIAQMTDLMAHCKPIDDEIQESRRLRQLVFMSTLYKGMLVSQLAQKLNKDGTISKQKLVQFFRSIKMEQSYIQDIITDMSLYSTDLNHLNFHKYFERFCAQASKNDADIPIVNEQRQDQEQLLKTPVEIVQEVLNYRMRFYRYTYADLQADLNECNTLLKDDVTQILQSGPFFLKKSQSKILIAQMLVDKQTEISKQKFLEQLKTIGQISLPCLEQETRILRELTLVVSLYKSSLLNLIKNEADQDGTISKCKLVRLLQNLQLNGKYIETILVILSAVSKDMQHLKYRHIFTEFVIEQTGIKVPELPELFPEESDSQKSDSNSGQNQSQSQEQYQPSIQIEKESEKYYCEYKFPSTEIIPHLE